MIKKEFGFIIFFLGTIYFLITLPSTMMDYDIYKQAYDNAYMVNEYPWFKTDTSLTAEPFYLWYTSFLGVVLPFNFGVYLAVNFVICIVISLIAMRKLFKKEIIFFFWLFFLPVILPTIFYFSPRSSLSFFFVFLGFVFLIRKKQIGALFFLFLAISTHSQYLLSALLILATYLLFKKLSKSKMKIILLVSIGLFIFLKISATLILFLGNFFSFLPSSDIITAKLGYLTNSKSGFRFTGVLSIVIYPIITYLLLKKVLSEDRLIFFKKNKSLEIEFMYLAFSIIVYGAIINLAFFSTPHIAGRLSRFSDYIGMGLVLPVFFRYNLKNNLVYVVLLLLILVAPFLYGTLYQNVIWGF